LLLILQPFWRSYFWFSFFFFNKPVLLRFGHRWRMISCTLGTPEAPIDRTEQGRQLGWRTAKTRMRPASAGNRPVDTSWPPECASAGLRASDSECKVGNPREQVLYSRKEVWRARVWHTYAHTFTHATRTLVATHTLRYIYCYCNTRTAPGQGDTTKGPSSLHSHKQTGPIMQGGTPKGQSSLHSHKPWQTCPPDDWAGGHTQRNIILTVALSQTNLPH